MRLDSGGKGLMNSRQYRDMQCMSAYVGLGNKCVEFRTGIRVIARVASNL